MRCAGNLEEKLDLSVLFLSAFRVFLFTLRAKRQVLALFLFIVL